MRLRSRCGFAASLRVKTSHRPLWWTESELYLSTFLSSSLPSTAAHLGHVTISVYSLKDWPRVEPLWGKLADSSPYSSFHLSAEWIGSWLDIFGELLQSQILIFEDQGVAVGACLLVKSNQRQGPFRVRRIYLNTGGEDPADRGTAEFNDLLCLPGYEQAIAKALGAHLSALEWDEFAVDGMCPGPILSKLQSDCFPGLLLTSIVRPSFHVNLDHLRQSGIPYERSLSPNTRQQLRRSLRFYSHLGSVRTEVAQDIARVEEFFDEMIQLHNLTWKGRGEPGAFASTRRLAFHRSLIRRAFARGCIQMLRVTTGNETIGVLYTILCRTARFISTRAASTTVGINALNRASSLTLARFNTALSRGLATTTF